MLQSVLSDAKFSGFIIDVSVHHKTDAGHDKEAPEQSKKAHCRYWRTPLAVKQSVASVGDGQLPVFAELARYSAGDALSQPLQRPCGVASVFQLHMDGAFRLGDSNTGTVQQVRCEVVKSAADAICCEQAWFKTSTKHLRCFLVSTCLCFVGPCAKPQFSASMQRRLHAEDRLFKFQSVLKEHD